MHANVNRSDERKMTIIILKKCAKKPSILCVAGSRAQRLIFHGFHRRHRIMLHTHTSGRAIRCVYYKPSL